jgi:hypothetical protein
VTASAAKCSIGALLAVGICVLSVPALAEEGATRAEARLHFQEGLAKVRAGEMEGAVEAFESAYRTSPRYQVLYNLGQAYASVGRSVDAVHTLERFLSEGGEQVESARRTQVEALIARERAKLGAVQIEVTPAEAEVFLDGRRLGTGPFETLELVAGDHVVVARYGESSRVAPLALAPGEVGQVRLNLEPEPQPALVPLATPPLTAVVLPPKAPMGYAAATNASNHQRTWAVGIGIGGAVLAATALAVYQWNTGRYEDWLKSRNEFNRSLAQAGPDSMSSTQADSLMTQAAKIQRADDAALGLAFAAGGALVTAGILWLTSGAGHGGAANTHASGPVLPPY